MESSARQADPGAPRASRRFSARRRRRLAATTLVALLLLAGGGYVAAVAATPLPELNATLEVDAEVRIDADPAGAVAAVAGQARPTALGWAEGEEVWANSEEVLEIASITKLVTVLVGLSAAPIDPANDPGYEVTAADAKSRDEMLAVAGLVEDTPIGLRLPSRQLLELILLPSANNYAISYARSIFGDDAAFAQAAAAWAQANGLTSLRVVEPTGISPENVSNPSDLIRLARLALADPLIAEIVAQSSADIPGIGVIESTNPLLGLDGVVGLKTGTTYRAGYNLLAARHDPVGERWLTAITVVLAREGSAQRADDAWAVLEAALVTDQAVAVVAEGGRIGSVTTWTGEEVALVTTAGADAVIIPGESVVRSNALGEVGAGSAGTAVGPGLVTGPTEVAPIPVVTAAPIEEPDLWWRLTHPGEVFG